jgi:hypothetical protein
VADIQGTQQAASSPAAGSVQQPQASPAGGTVQSGGGNDELSRLRTELEQARQWESRFKGVQPFYQKASELGFKSADDLQKWGPVFKTLGERKIGPEDLTRFLTAPVPDDDGRGGGGRDDFDPQKFREELKRELAEEAAWKDHDAAYGSESKLIESMLAEIAGENPDDYTRELHKLAAEAYFWRNRSDYPDGHPLKGKAHRAYDEEGTKKAAAYFKELRTKSAGAKMAQVASAASGGRTPAASAARDGGGNGKTNKDEGRKNGLPTTDDGLAKLREVRARRSNGTVSSLGG